MNDKEIFDCIKKYYLMGKLCIFVGAGVSRLSNLPSWVELVQSMADEINYKYKKDINGIPLLSSDELLKIPQIYFNNKGKKEYNNKIKGSFQGDYKPNEIHNLIFTLNPNHILTTNYDTLIEETSVNFGRNFSVLNSDDVVSEATTSNYIIKLHGDFSKEFVFKEQDYLDYEHNYILLDNIAKTIFSTNLVIFIGYSLNDYNIKLILNWVKRIQSDKFIKPIFIHTGDKIDKNELLYQKGRNLNILDCNDYLDDNLLDDNEFLQRYKIVLTKITSYTLDIFKYTKREDKLNYIYNRINKIKNINYIRREDFKCIFNNEYIINDKWIIEGNLKEYIIPLEHLDKIEIDYFEDFFKNKDEYEKIDKDKYYYIFNFLKKIGIRGIKENYDIIKIDDNITETKFPIIKINSLAFEFNIKKMQEFCSKNYENIYDNYKKAYYLAKLTRYKESYDLYTKILIDAKKNEEWDIYYFSQINRKYLINIIEHTIGITTGFKGAVMFGKEHKLFDKELLPKIKFEINFDDLYFELPYEIRNKFYFIKDFSKNIFKLNEYYTLIKDKYEYEIEDALDIRRVGAKILKFDTIKNLMLEKEKFLYENMLLLDNFLENQIYIKNYLICWIKGYIRENSKNGNSIFDIKNSHFNFTLQDIILISKTFDNDDIKYLHTIIKDFNILFDDTVKLEEYLNNHIDTYLILFEDFKKDLNVVLWKQFDKEIKNMLRITPYFVKDENCKLNAINFIINIPEINFNISDKTKIINKWISFSNTQNWSDILEVIENWFIQIYTFINNNSNSQIDLYRYTNYIMEICYILKNIFIKNKFKSEKISKVVIEYKTFLEDIKIIYTILNNEAQSLFNNYKVSTINEVLELINDINIPRPCNDELIIKKYLEELLLKRQNYEEEIISEIAIYMFMKDISYDFTKIFNGISDEYDFLLNIENFNKENFKVYWLLNYSDELIEKIKSNAIQKKIIVDEIRNLIPSLNLRKEQIKRLFIIYDMLR